MAFSKKRAEARRATRWGEEEPKVEVKVLKGHSRASTMEGEHYKQRMRDLSSNRDFRVRFRDVIREPEEQIEQQLSELQANTHDSHRAKAERFVRAILRVVGAVQVSWYP